MGKLFAGAADFGRVNPLGLALMAVAVVLAALAGMLSRRLRPEAPDGIKSTIKIVALVICAGGAPLAILG